MLKIEDLRSQIQSSIQSIVVPAIERCKLSEYPANSKIGREKAKEFADNFDMMVSEQLANAIAGAIDYYIRNAAITGYIITTGSPVTQTAVITSSPTPIINGTIPNTLGIN